MTPIGDDVRLGVACLGVTHAHASGRVRAVQRHGNASMRGCADEDPVTPIFADARGLEVRSKRDILDDPDVHAVLVHSKSDKMAALSIEALEAGKAVLVEKPAGRNAQDTRNLVEAVERTGGLLQVGYCWRFSRAVAEMQKAIRENRLGDIFQVRGHAGCHLGEAATSHLNQPQDVGGSLFVIGPMEQQREGVGKWCALDAFATSLNLIEYRQLGIQYGKPDIADVTFTCEPRATQADCR